MPLLRTIHSPAHLDALLARLERLAPTSQRRWGRMTPHQAVCHLADSMRATLGEWHGRPHRVGLLRRTVGFLAFTVPVRWPHGFRTARELDQERDGTKPVEFARDRSELAALVRRLAQARGRGLPPHPLWGRLGAGETGRYVWRHMDHHLRQFGA